jgi:hypothetical protein
MHYTFFSAFLALVLFAQVLRADDALVLPEGRFRVRLISTFSDLENKYDGSGALSSYGSPFSRNIDGALLAALTRNPKLTEAVRSLNAVAPGSGDALLSEKIATLQTDVSTKVFANLFVLEYGVTSRLSLGVIVPLIHASTTVHSESAADPAFQQKTENLNSKDPRKAIRSELLNNTSVAAIDQILTDQFKYTGMKSWSGTGIGDIDLGFKYNYYREHPLRATLKSGVRIPTGRQDDPDQLFDVGFGDGQFDLAIFNYVDYDMLSNVSFTWELGYTEQLPDSGNFRIPLSQDLPIGATSLSLDRKLGDYWETGLETNVSPTKNLILSAKYHFKQKFLDSYTGDVDTSLLELDTNEILHEGCFQVEYTNLQDVRAGRDHVPYGLVAFYKLPLAGENIADSRTAGIQFKTYF